jgi:cyclohexa-1,5-dienecarbonyl-CoA hydratase
MAYGTIEFHPGPRLASIALSRPPLNIVTMEMLDELNVALDEVEELQAQILVFSGKGERAFSAGVEVRDHAPERAGAMLAKFHRVLERVRESDAIAIAAIHGHTLGGGAELALTCDLVVAADDTELGFPEINVGCYPPAGAAFLPTLIGLHKASELVFLGASISADEAVRVGLVNRVVPRANLSEAVDRYVDALLEKSAPILALAKRALRAGSERPFKDALDLNEKLYVDSVSRVADMQEGIDAFLEKRPPAWKNR